ncbi:hypothetical protein RRG08_051665 [Elysia crispata]|uniref:Uncharacterized protein n=1 Tax=Elysia crispata TaxID=231223 RepID=A0AAE1A3B7_9GAST|nr:hypothetical protein RRG08_051665 [Elysia crispata]
MVETATSSTENGGGLAVESQASGVGVVYPHVVTEVADDVTRWKVNIDRGGVEVKRLELPPVTDYFESKSTGPGGGGLQELLERDRYRVIVEAGVTATTTRKSPIRRSKFNNNNNKWEGENKRQVWLKRTERNGWENKRRVGREEEWMGRKERVWKEGEGGKRGIHGQKENSRKRKE